TCIHFTGRQVMQYRTPGALALPLLWGRRRRALSLRWLMNAGCRRVRLLRAGRRCGRLCSTRRRCRECRLVVLRADRTALAGLDHNRLRTTPAHILAHSALAHSRRLQGEGLLNPKRLVVFVVGHSVPVPSNEDGWRTSDLVYQCMSLGA